MSPNCVSAPLRVDTWEKGRRAKPIMNYELRIQEEIQLRLCGSACLNYSINTLPQLRAEPQRYMIAPSGLFLLSKIK